MLMSSRRASLVVIDAQERLVPAMSEPERVIKNISILIRAARELGVPILASEQYPRGLGPTLPEISDLWPADLEPIAKTDFSCLDEPVFARAFKKIDRDQTIICGVEAHVCVLQTALAARSVGKNVFVIADACASRVPLSAERAYDRLRDEGVAVATTEMVVFEWLRRAGGPAFKTLSGLVR